ncbi:MAG: exo-alpha-sialidase, partial [Acidobacteriaceae bacterium]|nr:exo-alpha-sialidase [Acidobacteriaceae bacterium]
MALGQGARMRADAGEQEESERDRPLEREQWLRLGRRVPGDAAAVLRYKAYQQKMAQRAKSDAARTSAQTGSATSAASSTATSTATWVPLGPAPMLSDPTGAQSYGYVSGRATRVLVDQTDPTGNTLYLGGAYAGLWKSTNAAAASPSAVVWTPLLDDQPTLAVGAIAITPANNNLLLVGTGEPNSSADSYYGLGILRSTNGGASWTLISSADSGAHPFKGLGFSHIVFSTSNPNVVVAATAATNGNQSGAAGPNSVRGLYYSTDAGITWAYATITDGATAITPGSTTSVVFNPTLQRFFATVRYHGVYTSIDGAHWTRLGTQPGGNLLGASVCSPMTNSSCPLYRGELAVVPGTATMFVWFVDNTDKNQGIYVTTDGGATWAALDVSGINSCGDSAGCGTAQGGYNLALAALPAGGGAIDLYAGAVNLFKCSMSSASATCAGAWKNLTHVYGCSPLARSSHVHPDQHDISFSVGNSNVMYFANDGGIYRTLNAAGLTSGSCSAANPFDNLNGSLGSMTEYVSFSQGVDLETLLGGTQDNGSPATNSVHSTSTWTEVNGGDGGFNAINPNSPQQWLTANTDVSIQRCDSGFSCTAGAFPVTVGPQQVGNDHGDFYTPFILDPQMTDNVIV